MKPGIILITLSLLFAGSTFPTETAPKPKYGPEATPVSLSHEYFRKNPAPDYWALSPYYTAQFNEKACSIASLTMIMNAARVGIALNSEEKLVTQEALLNALKEKKWNDAVGKHGHGVSLNELGELVKTAMGKYGLSILSVEIAHLNDTSPETRKRLHQALVENEKTDRDFMIANFIQGSYTDDAFVGHIAPVGAYDAKRRRVLILDPDRKWYEPYWVSEEIFLKGMVTKDKHSGNEWRGYVWIKLNN